MELEFFFVLFFSFSIFLSFLWLAYCMAGV